MNFEPQKFFIGLVDFFSILLPGALLTYLLKDDIGSRFLGDSYSKIVGTEGWIIFFFSAYLLGHFVFLVGSWLLDGRLYDPIRKATYDEQVRRLAMGRKLSPFWARRMAALLFNKDADQAVRRAVRIKEHYLDPLNASSAINAFQWCKARLTLEHPQAMATVQRFEADSKFFRSLFVVLCFIIPWGLLQGRPAIAAVSVPLLPLVFWRYADQRVKATNQAYWYIITLDSQREGGLQLPPHAPAHASSHAGGVVFRQLASQTEYLLVQARNAPHEWVLAKGHIEPDETMQETAVREVREETGVWARIKSDLGNVSFTADGTPVKFQVYLLERVAEDAAGESGRRHEWLSFDRALKKASHKETQSLLELAQRKLTEA